MTKRPLEPFGNSNVAENLFYWMKQYLVHKIMTLGVKSEFAKDFDRTPYAKIVEAATSIEQISNTIREAKRKGLGSISVYFAPVARFYSYVAADKKIESLKEVNTSYRDSYFTVNPGGLEASTLEGELVQISSLFKFIEQNNIDAETGKPYTFNLGRTRGGRRTANPIVKGEKEIIYFEPDELKRFLDGMETFAFKVPNTARPKLMMKLVAFGGLRGEELIGLKKSSITFVQDPSPLLPGRFMRLVIFGKGSKERIVYIKASLVEKEYKSHIADTGHCKNDLLFCNAKGGKYALRTVYDLVRRLMEHAKIDKGGHYGLHILRRSYASFMFLKGVEFAVVSELLGHGDQEVTDLYVKISREGLREVARLWEDV